MRKTAPVRAVITGAPGAGKSTLLEELARRGINVMREVARDILRDPGGMALRRDNPDDFARTMFEGELRGWSEAEERGGLTVFDRGFPDLIGFLHLEGCAVPPAISQACRTRRYEGPIFRAPPWRAIYRRDEERIQNWEEAVASDQAICAAWRASGYRLVDLPLTTVAERVEFLLGHIGAA